MSHTKTPWAVEVMPSGRTTITSGQFFVAGDENGHGIEASDAAFIVRAVNAHDELVAALEDIAEGCSFPEDAVQEAVCKRARAALDKLAAA